jgi:hypothetical protein
VWAESAELEESPLESLYPELWFYDDRNQRLYYLRQEEPESDYDLSDSEIGKDEGARTLDAFIARPAGSPWGYWRYQKGMKDDPRVGLYAYVNDDGVVHYVSVSVSQPGRLTKDVAA